MKKIAKSMTKVVAPTMANLMSSWCRSATAGSPGRRLIVASAKDTSGVYGNPCVRVPGRSAHCDHDTMNAVRRTRAPRR